MGWGTTLFTNLYFSRETFRSKLQVEDALESQRSMFADAKQNLRKYAFMTEPRRFMSEDELKDSNPDVWLEERVNDAISTIEETSVEIYRLELLLERWDNCHNEQGLAIDPPDDIHWNSTFLEGDFVPSVKHPDVNKKNGLQ